MSTSDFIARRRAIAHFLGIPATLVILNEHFVDSLTKTMPFLEKDLFRLYEDMLTIAWDSFRRSKDPQVINKIDENVSKLTQITQFVPEREREPWLSLLCRFNQLLTRVAQHSMNEQRALLVANWAIAIAIKLNNAELIASAFYRRSRVHMEYFNIALDEEQKARHIALAKVDIDTALGYVERLRPPLAGNIYLIAAEVYTCLTSSEASLRIQCEKWQDKAAKFVYGGNIEDDGTFLKLNPTAFHHEKAKTLLQLGQIQDARRELNTSWGTLQPNILTWHMNMHLTEASLFLAERDLEGSSKSGLKAYALTKTIQSYKGEAEVKHLLVELQKRDNNNLYVRDFALVVSGES